MAMGRFVVDTHVHPQRHSVSVLDADDAQTTDPEGDDAHQVGNWGTALREREKFATETSLLQDDPSRVLGKNFCDIYDVAPPHARRSPEHLDP